MKARVGCARDASGMSVQERAAQFKEATMTVAAVDASPTVLSAPPSARLGSLCPCCHCSMMPEPCVLGYVFLLLTIKGGRVAARQAGSKVDFLMPTSIYMSIHAFKRISKPMSKHMPKRASKRMG